MPKSVIGALIFRATGAAEEPPAVVLIDRFGLVVPAKCVRWW